MTSPGARLPQIWAVRNFRLLWFGETTSRGGTAITTVALPLVAVISLHTNALLVGVLAAASWLPWLAIGLPSGAIVDRLPNRWLMLVCDAVSAVLLLSVPLAWWCGVLTIWQLIAVAMVVGCAGVFFLSAVQVMFSKVISGDLLEPANTWVQGSEAASRIVGPGVAGWLAQALGAVVGVLIDALTYLISATCLLAIPAAETRSKKVAPRQRLVDEVREGVRYVAHDQFLRTIALYAAVCNMAAGALQAVQIVFAVRSVGLTAGAIGTMIAIGGFGGLLGAVLVSRVIRRLGNARALVLAGLITGPFALLLPLTTRGAGIAFFIIGTIVMDSGLLVANVVIDSFRQLYCRPAVLGRVVASTRCLTYGAGAIGSVGGGVIASLVDPRIAMWIAALLQAGAVGVLLASPVRSRRRFPAADAKPVRSTQSDFAADGVS